MFEIIASRTGLRRRNQDGSDTGTRDTYFFHNGYNKWFRNDFVGDLEDTIASGLFSEFVFGW